MISVIRALGITAAAANADCFVPPVARMKIGEFRRLVDSLNWARGWFTGGAPEEFKRQNVPAGLAEHMEKVAQAMPGIAPRFADDLAAARSALEYAARTIERWHSRQSAAV